MPGDTKIGWADSSWNPTTGCTRVSDGCDYCYAEALTRRMAKQWHVPDLPWTPENAEENVIRHPERLGVPTKWKKPRRIFVNSMSDLFHPRIPGEFINQVWAEMHDNPRHTFIVLTKRPKRLRDWTRAKAAAMDWPEGAIWPDWMWVGTSIENRDHIDRADMLRQTPAAVRVISAEPLLGPLVPDCNCGQIETPHFRGDEDEFGPGLDLTGIRWLIVGGESGSTFRPMDLRWMKGLYAACLDQGWTCQDCGCLGTSDETFCYRCGAGQPKPGELGGRPAFFAKQDNHRLPDQRGRIPDELWVQEYPVRAAQEAQGVLL